MNEIEFNLVDGESIEFNLEPSVIELEPPLENLEATPTQHTQNFESEDYYGYDKVKVNPIPSEYVIPTGTKNITENGNVDVTNFINANVQIPIPTLGAKTITTNGTYRAEDDNLGGYSEVSVETSGVDIDEYFNNTINSFTPSAYNWIPLVKKFKSPIYLTGTSWNSAFYKFLGTEIPIIASDSTNVTDMAKMFSSCQNITSLDVSNFNTSNVTNMSEMFYNCRSLTSLDVSNFNTSNVTNMSEMFYNCRSLTSLDVSNFNTSNVTGMRSMFSSCSSLTSLDVSNFDFSSCIDPYSMFASCTNLTNLTFGKNLGKAYPADVSVGNASTSTVNLNTCNNLTHDSLMSVINNLYDISSTVINHPYLRLGSTNYNKLTAEERSIAINKGWDVRSS